MNTQEAYSHWSSTYDHDRNLTRDLDQTVTKNILANLRFKSVLEIGCGTGKNTALLAEIAENVWAFDFSVGMIEKARQKVPAGNVSFVVTDLTREWPCNQKTVDLIACNLVLEHVRDLSFIFAEAFRVLVKEGRFFVCRVTPFPSVPGHQSKFPARAANDGDRSFCASPVRFHQRGSRQWAITGEHERVVARRRSRQTTAAGFFYV